MKTDDLRWVVSSDPPPLSHGMCCPKQKVGEGGVSEINFENKKCWKSLFKKSKNFRAIDPAIFNGLSSKIWLSDQTPRTVEG